MGIRRLVDEIEEKPVRELAAEVGRFGDDRVAGAVEEFARRWHHGVKHLTTDLKEIDGRLQQAIRAYAGHEQRVIDMLSEINQEKLDD